MQEGDKEERSAKLLEPGEQFGDYVVESLLGNGGMGAVYLVRSPGGDRYAVKVMYPWMLEKSRDYRRRFAREAEFAMKIRHRNLISVYDVGEDPETGLYYIIMDYVPGGTVADRLEREGRLPIQEAVSIASQVAMALEVAHRHGVIHRDIKPDNIMFDADGTPRLADLGVAKFMDGEQKTTVTTTGMVIGTPAYMAPEQMIDSHRIDARADIYALGVVLYEMLTGKRPREGSTAVELLAKAIKGEPIPDVRTQNPEVTEAVAYVLSLMCAPRPDGRPGTALEAAKLLRNAGAGRLVMPKKPQRTAVDSAGKARRNGTIIALSVALAVSLCAAITTAFVKSSATRDPPMPPPPQPQVVVTNTVVRTLVETNIIERVVEKLVTNTVFVATNAPSKPSAGSDKFTFTPPVQKFRMKVNEDALRWMNGGNAEATIRVCHDLSHGGFPGANNVFSTNFFKGASNFRSKTCWHDLASENLDSVNVLVLPPSSAQVLYSDEDNAAIGKFLSHGGTVIAFVAPDESNVWSMNRFFAPYGLEVFAAEEGERRNEWQAVPSCPLLGRMSPRLVTSTFAAPANEAGTAEWSSVLTDWNGGRVVFATRRVGNGNLVYAAAGLMWGRRDDNGNPMPIKSEENSRFWLGIFRLAAQNHFIPTGTQMGERAATDAPVTLTAGPITIYSSNRWKDSAYKLRDVVLQALPYIERYCGWPLGPDEIEHTKFVLIGTSVGGCMKVGAKTLVLGAMYGGFPDRIQDLSATVFRQIACGVAQDDFFGHFPCYISQRLLADMGFPDKLNSIIAKGRELDPEFSKYRLTDNGVLLDEKGNAVRENYGEIVHAKIFSALENIRLRHSVPNYIKRRKSNPGKLNLSQCVGLFTEVTGDDCSKIFAKYGIACSPNYDAPKVDTGGMPRNTVAVRRVVFPCADVKDTKWKNRTPWRYVTHPPASSSLNWTDPAYRDLVWQHSNKPFGMGKGNKELMYIAEKWSSPHLYLRRNFKWNGGKVTRVEFTLYNDCRVKIYLNGTTILDRSDYPRDGWWKVEVPVDVFAAALREGDNVLAVEAHEIPRAPRYFDCGLTVEAEEMR